MRTLIIWALYLNLLFGASYDFDEIKFIAALEQESKKSGHIDIEASKVQIIYYSPTFKKIVKTDENLTIEGKDGDIYALKGKALFYTRQFISVMSSLGEYQELKTNPAFRLEQEGDEYIVNFMGDIADIISQAIVHVKNEKVSRFKMLMHNGDTLEIIKK